MVQSADGTYSKVYGFGHYSPEQNTSFLQIKTKSSQIEITSNHLIYMHNDEKGVHPVPAGDVKVGDLLVSLEEGSSIEVQSIQKVQRNGAYTPLTASGDLVVNGLVASNYVMSDWLDGKISGQVLHWTLHGANQPYRLFCIAAAGCENETYDDSTGYSPWVLLSHRVEQWMLGLHGALQVVFLTLMIVPALCALVVGKLMAAPSASMWSMAHLVAAVIGCYAWKKTQHQKEDTETRKA